TPLSRPPEQLDRASTSASGTLCSRQKAADQLNCSYDAGDFIVSPAGRHHLARLAGSIAIRVQAQAQRREVLRGLVAEGGLLAGYTVEMESAKGVTLLQAPESERRRQLL